MEKFYFYERGSNFAVQRTHEFSLVIISYGGLATIIECQYSVAYTAHKVYHAQKLISRVLGRPSARPPSDACALHKFPTHPNRVVKVPAHHIYYVFRPC